MSPLRPIRTMGRKERMGWGGLVIILVVLCFSYRLAMAAKLTAEWTGLIGAISLLMGSIIGGFNIADSYNTGTALKHGKAPPEGTTG